MPVSHEAGWAHADGALKGPSWLRQPADPNELATLVCYYILDTRRRLGTLPDRPLAIKTEVTSSIRMSSTVTTLEP